VKELLFIQTIDQLKSVYRQTYLSVDPRHESSAEHSWHMAMMLLLLERYATEPFDLLRAVKMALIHDLVEIEAGDTYAFAVFDAAEKHEQEKAAAENLFGMLPEEGRAEFLELWHEFEQRSTPEARIVKAMDALQPILTHISNEGRSWRENGIRREQVANRAGLLRQVAPALWERVVEMLDTAQLRGWLL
jgi:putative hydrolase of HD superfamily